MARKGIFLAGLVLVCTAVGSLPLADADVWEPMPAPVVGGGGGGGVVRFPYTVADHQGRQWFFYNYGQFRQQGNMPVYGEGGMLQINSAYPQNRVNQAKVDGKTGELVIEGLDVAGFELTRRISVNKEEGYVRYIDIIRNAQNREQTANLQFNTNINYGVQMATMLPDPKNPQQNIAWLASTHANGQVVVEMFGGKRAKVVPTINYMQGQSHVQAVMSQTIPAGKAVALMHFHLVCPSQDVGRKFVLEMKESKLLADLPSALRKLIINFRGGENFVGDYEILRGDVLDVVELRSGDQLKGTLREKSFRLRTFYGPVELAVSNVIGLINAGEFRPRQLLITKEGEIFGGRLEREALSLELSSGQVTEIPLSQISRMGYRKRAGEPEEWTFEKPTVFMQTGERIGVEVPTKEIEVITRYGRFALKPETVAAINFHVEEHGVHEIHLSDGSRFAGLIVGEVFEMKLADGGLGQAVGFPASAIRRLQLAKPVESVDEKQARLNLAHDDVLVGSLIGVLKLDTAFNTLTLNAREIRRLEHKSSSPTDVQVVLWDETSISGQLQEPEVICLLKSGLAVKVPVGLVSEYVQPRPQPSAAVIENIKALVAQLDADDWRQRDRAQEKLMVFGDVVIPTLRDLRATQSPEAQQRIDLILKQLGEKAGAAGGEDSVRPRDAAAPVAAPAVMEMQMIEH